MGEESTGYQALNAGSNNNGKNKRIAWTQDEQDELKDLFDKYKSRFENKNTNEDENENDQDEAEAELEVPDEDEKEAGDIIDLIMLKINDGSRKRKDLCNQLVNIGCVKSMDDFKNDKFTFKDKKRWEEIKFGEKRTLRI